LVEEPREDIVENEEHINLLDGVEQHTCSTLLVEDWVEEEKASVWLRKPGQSVIGYNEGLDLRKWFLG
jgi:hypothetical protein